MRTATDAEGYLSSRLLKRQPTGATTGTAVYGSGWCAGCHKGRAMGLHDVINHPVEATAGAGIFTYEALQVLTGANSSETDTGTLGRSNFGYVMPFPRTAEQDGHDPICQQCHEDARTLGDVTTGTVALSEVFKVTNPDGLDSGDNPRFQVFPHESANAALLIETGDDLCTNCHDASLLN